MNATMSNDHPYGSGVDDSLGKRSRAGAAREMREMAAIDAAKSDLDNVNVFAKLMKKAEEAAQAAL